MPKEELTDLLSFLEPFPPDVQEKVLWLRDFVWDRYPQCNELIYDNYNNVAVGWSPTEKAGQVFCTIAIMRPYGKIHFGFYWGAQIRDPENLLIGDGKQYRYMRIENLVAFPENYIAELLKDAYQVSMDKVKNPKDIAHGKTIVKAVSEKKRESKKAI